MNAPWRRALAAECLLVLLAACGEGDEPEHEVPPQEFDVVVGWVYAETDLFAPLTSADDVEINVGFQGLNFVDLALRGSDAHPDRMSAMVDVAFPDAPDRDYSFRDNTLEFHDEPDHRRAALRVPIGQDVAVVAGSRVDLRVELTAPGWRAEASAQFRLVDNEQCVENAEGELECP